jgi:HTH-type transcriptional regulator, sugar sensing transcriptional regulator
MIKTDSPIYKSLISIGFSEKEALVYLALLQLGKRTVTVIARNANINRTTVYDILDSLAAKGLVSISGKEPLQEYVAESPDKVLILVKQDIERKQTQLKEAENLVPQLKSMHNVTDRPQVRFYEGTEGMEQVYEDTLTSTETIRAYANVNEMHTALPHYFPKYYKRRTNKGIRIRAIIPSNAAGVERVSKDKEEARESALVPEDRIYFSPEINIYNNKIMIASWKEKLGIIIQSKEIADAMKTIYELAWVEAKRLEDSLKSQAVEN